MAIERPAVGSDEWFYWLIDQINGGEGTALTDEAIAAIVDRENSHTRASIVALYMAGDGSVLREAKAYADTTQIAAVSAAKTYSDTANTSVLAEATKRISSAVAAVSVPLQNYADSKDSAVRSAAFAQAAQEGANAKAAANTYTDQKTADIGKAITDGDAATLTEAKRYADTVGGGASFETIRSYVDTADQQVRTDVQQFATNADADTLRQASLDAQDKAGKALSDAKAYVNGLGVVTPQDVSTGDAATLASAKVYVDGVTSGALSAAQLYADNADGETLSAAKDYTDNTVENAATGISASVDGKVQAGVDTATNYADTLNTATLNQVSALPTKAYVDNGDTAALNAAKAYTDTKQTDTGWVAVTPISGWASGSTMFVRTKNGRTQMRGQLKLDSGNITGSTAAVFTLPVGSRPTTLESFMGAGATSAYGKLSVNTNGTVDVTAGTGTTTYLFVSQVTFWND